MALLTRLAKQVYRRSTGELLGMHMRHLMALSYVRDHDGGPQQELAEALCMDANNVVLLLNELEGTLALVTRRRDPADRRRHVVQLSPQGRSALERALYLRQEAIEDEVLAALDAEERATLWRLLGRALYAAEPVEPGEEGRSRQLRPRPQPDPPSGRVLQPSCSLGGNGFLQEDDQIDLDQGTLRQRRHTDGGARGRRRREERRVLVRDGGERAEIGRVDRQAQRALQRRSGWRTQTSAQVLQAAARLLAGRVADELAAGAGPAGSARSRTAGRRRAPRGCTARPRRAPRKHRRSLGRWSQFAGAYRESPLHARICAAGKRGLSTTADANVSPDAKANADHHVRGIAGDLPEPRRRERRSPAHALPFAPCANVSGFSCASVAMPLDRSGKVPGTVAMTIERKAASAASGQSAVVALAAGPGQAAAPLGELLARAIAPALATRDLLVFDQRGTGHSSPLNCPVFANIAALESATESTLAPLVELCALQIGPERGSFTTQESVEDIEAIRHAAGDKKLVLYGTSYVTKVALEYAERYPQHVESLVLEGVVPRERTGTVRRRALCGDRLGARRTVLSTYACAEIIANPLGDLARLIARLRKHRLQRVGVRRLGQAPRGVADRARRAEHPAGGATSIRRCARCCRGAVHSALNGDPDPLLRLNLIAEGLVPSVPIRPNPELERASQEEENNALFLTTSCEETLFPWQRSATTVYAPRGSARRAARAAGRRGLAVQLDGGAGQQPGADLRLVARRLAGARRAGRAAERADADPLRWTGPAHADVGRRAVASLIPDAQVLVAPVHRTLGARQRLQRVRAGGRRRFLRRHARAAVRRMPRTSSRRRLWRRASSPTCTRRRG